MGTDRNAKPLGRLDSATTFNCKYKGQGLLEDISVIDTIYFLKLHHL